MTTWVPTTLPLPAWTLMPGSGAVFDPTVFDLRPIFDTEGAANQWLDETKPVNAWVPVL